MNLLDTVTAKTADELTDLAKNRYFDQIAVVVDDVHRVQKNLEKLYDLKKWFIQDGKSACYPGKVMSTWMNDIELLLIEPDEQNSAWKKYEEKFGTGIASVRENVSKENLVKELDRYQAMNIEILQHETDVTGETVILDTMEQIGGYIALHADSADRVYPAETERNKRHLTQINVTTDDVDRTVRQLTNLLQIGPWSIGTLNNQTVKNAHLLIDGEYVTPEFQFQLAITLIGNLEFEVIQPVKGETVYKTYLDRRTVGYHHIKEVVAPEELQKTLDMYEAEGMKLAIKGTMDITTFAYLDCEKEFTFYVELGDGLPPNALPEGYNEYIYPAK